MGAGPSLFVHHAGLAGAWIGLTIQHCGNHGAMSTKPWVNKAMGLTDDLIGGSSLMWRYHHQVTAAVSVLWHLAAYNLALGSALAADQLEDKSPGIMH